MREKDVLFLGVVKIRESERQELVQDHTHAEDIREHIVRFACAHLGGHPRERER